MESRSLNELRYILQSSLETIQFRPEVAITKRYGASIGPASAGGQDNAGSRLGSSIFNLVFLSRLRN